MHSRPFHFDSCGPLCSHAYVAPLVLHLLAGQPEGARILDLGCGNGSLLSVCQGRGWKLHGIDLSVSAIKLARECHPSVSFSVGDVTETVTYPPNYFDAIASTEVIEHLYNPRQFIANCYRLLKPRGKLILSTPYHGYLKNLALAVAGKFDAHFTALDEGGHIKFWSRRTLATALREAGFQEIGFAGAGRFPLLWKSMVMTATTADCRLSYPEGQAFVPHPLSISRSA